MMNKIKQFYYETIYSIPERALLELNKQIISAFCIYITLVVLLLFSHLWGLALILTVIFLVYGFLIFYQMLLFKKGEIIEIAGKCTAVDKDTLPYNRNYIFVATGNEAYKVILRKKKKITLNSDVLVYARKNTISKQDAYMQINNCLMLFIVKVSVTG